MGFPARLANTTSPSETQRQVLSAAVLKLLRPLVRILLRSGIPYGMFADLAKCAYVEIATDEFTIRERRQTVSRVAVITGLSRKEVTRVQGLTGTEAAAAAERCNRAARVISGWVRDPRFLDEHGEPVPLSFEGDDGSFTELVKEFSGDVPARAILDELIHVGAVTQLDDGRINLVTHGYIPRESKADKLGILGTDVAHLLATIDHNVHQTDAEPKFQRKVAYDNLPAEALAALRSMGANEAQKLLERIDRWMAEHDRDTRP
ncbi:MAG: DUF6502 family protein, partial [Acidiferrobacterales bacterium]